MLLLCAGLTDIEIDEAIKLSGVPATNHAPPLPVRTLTSTTTSWWEYALLGTLAGGAGYALYHVVKVLIIICDWVIHTYIHTLPEVRVTMVSREQSTRAETG